MAERFWISPPALRSLPDKAQAKKRGEKTDEIFQGDSAVRATESGRGAGGPEGLQRGAGVFLRHEGRGPDYGEYGRLRVLGGGVLEMRRDTGDPLPQALYNSKVKLRGFQRNSQPFCVTGTVGKSSRDFWQVENLEILQSRENRSFFRQNTELDARVMPSGHYRGTSREMTECKVLDVSAGGARILSRNVYLEGDRFQLEAELLPDERPFSVVCQVLRITPRKGFKYEYGCKFEGLSEQEQQRLLRAVFIIQRKMLQAQRE